MGTIGCPETSKRNCRYSLCDGRDKSNSQSLRVFGYGTPRGPLEPRTMWEDGCVKLRGDLILAPYNTITVIARGEKCILAYFNTKTQRKSAPGRPRRRGKDNIKLYLKQIVIMLTAFNRFGEPYGSVTCCRPVQKLSDHHLMTPCLCKWLLHCWTYTHGRELRYNCTGFWHH